MIFEDWCDQSRFLAKRWKNVCRFGKNTKVKERKPLDITNDSNGLLLTNFFANMMNEHLHGNDRYISAIWQHFHPNEELTDPKKQLKLTFPEFVHFLVKSTSEFDPEITRHKGLSYHWAPYWKECSQLCSPSTRPDFVIKMESLSEDTKQMLEMLGLEDKLHLFPRTHTQSGGHSSLLAKKYFSQLSAQQVQNLYDLYKLDHELFGYDIEPYLSYAKSN